MGDVRYNKSGAKVISQGLIDRLVAESRASPRQRAQLCLHTEKSDLIQAMFLALQPDTYKREIFTIWQGEVAVVTFADLAERGGY